MTAPDMVEIGALALYEIDPVTHHMLGRPAMWDELTKQAKDRYRERARVVLDAISEAGAVEWGVRYQTHIEPVVRTYHSKAIALAMLEDDDSEALVTRVAFPWERAE